jgi:hypothetical protein
MDNERNLFSKNKTPSPWQALSSSLFFPDPERTGYIFFNPFDFNIQKKLNPPKQAPCKR